jgi:hypothetical protein
MGHCVFSRVTFVVLRTQKRTVKKTWNIFHCSVVANTTVIILQHSKHPSSESINCSVGHTEDSVYLH